MAASMMFSNHISAGGIAGIVIICVIFGGIALFLCDPNKVVPAEVMMARQRARQERQAKRRAEREAKREMEKRNESLPQYSARARAITFASNVGSDPRTLPETGADPQSTSIPPASPKFPPGVLLPNASVSSGSQAAMDTDHPNGSQNSHDHHEGSGGLTDAPLAPSQLARTGDEEDDGVEMENDENRVVGQVTPMVSVEACSLAIPPPVYSPRADLNV